MPLGHAQAAHAGCGLCSIILYIASTGVSELHTFFFLLKPNKIMPGVAHGFFSLLKPNKMLISVSGGRRAGSVRIPTISAVGMMMHRAWGTITGNSLKMRRLWRWEKLTAGHCLLSSPPAPSIRCLLGFPLLLPFARDDRIIKH